MLSLIRIRIAFSSSQIKKCSMLKSIKGKVIPNKLEETCTWRKLWRTLSGGMPTFSIVSVPWSIYPLIIGRVKVRREVRVRLSQCWLLLLLVSASASVTTLRLRPGLEIQTLSARASSQLSPNTTGSEQFSKKILSRNLHSDRKEIFSILEIKWAIVLPEFYIFFHFDI